MNINKIKIEKFKSIYDSLELDFSNIQGFWKISGQVGAGKTTIGEAIIFGLFGSINGKNNKDLISWGEKHCIIEIWCESKGKNIHIYRENNMYGQSMLNVNVDGEDIIFSNKRNAQAQLENDYFDISKTTLELLCIISFNNFKSIATLGERDARIFLDQILGFEKLTELINICKDCKKENYININQSQIEVAKLESQIDKLNQLNNIKKIDGDIKELKKNININESKILNIKSTSGVQIDNLKQSLKEYNKQLTTILTLGKQKAKEIEMIKNGICPICGSKIDSSKLKDKELERNLLLQQHKQISDNIKNINIELEKNINIMNNSIKEIENDIKSDQIDIVRLEEYEKRTQINSETILELQQEINKTSKLLDLYNKEDREWEQLLCILSNNIRSNVLSSFLPIFNQNINRYALKLQLPYYITFDTKFKCTIKVNGCKDDISISSLSTGQLKVVDMVVILGLLGTLISNSNLNLMFLDELFSNLDIELRNNVCVLLRETISKNNTIFIISHQDIPEELLDGEINIKLIPHEKFHKKSLIICKNLK